MTHLYIRKPVPLIRPVSQIKLHILILRDLQTPQTHHSLSDQMNSLLSLYHQPEQQVASIMTPQCNFFIVKFRIFWLSLLLLRSVGWWYKNSSRLITLSPISLLRSIRTIWGSRGWWRRWFYPWTSFWDQDHGGKDGEDEGCHQREGVIDDRKQLISQEKNSEWFCIL